MCPGNETIQCALGMGLANPMRLANVPWEWDALEIGQANVPWEWDYPMCLGMGLANVPWKWDYSIQCALGMGLANVPICE